jgi:hypothetical protein
MMLAAALDALNRGFSIFPVARGAKVPHPAAGQWGETATNDPNRIVQFWTRNDPHANVGVACKPSQLLVVDLDQAKADWNLRGTEWAHLHAAWGERVSGEDLFDEMRFQLDDENSDPYDTFVVQTGSGGVHVYYQWPAHWPRISQASPVKGVVDVRGNGGQWGGYVLGAGSVTDAGAYHVINDQPLSLPPTWIRRLVVEKPQQPKIHRPKGLMQPGSISNSGLVDTVRNAGEGNRNNALVWAARTMCEEGVKEADAMQVLVPAAEHAGLGYREIERTIQSAYRTQQHKMG